ncbi:MAG TPA: 2,3-bisphosphoglycerate-dependent phosphoglycerate mutase [Alphaproteobacteria bacterium]|nr:2,3-bisphosphoglycerate-dependent phosphoglycerate mutase [Rhodospirillaceae bacterium]HRJ11949.1 2,3-bisphosphoglycerate-dependent phosphoglycerate mutase [Alphaproteobacteria bacterium]
MSQLILMRHGQSEWNLQNRFTGFKDVKLTEAGEAEARAAGEKLKAANIMPDSVFTSTLERAWRTAELALQSAGYNLPLQKFDDLRERDYGDLTGLNKAETAEKYGEEQVHIWRRSYDIAPPAGESLSDVVGRVEPFFLDHIQPLLIADQTVMIAAHGNSLRALLIVLGIYTPDNIQHAEIPTGAPLLVNFEAGVATTHDYL